MKHLGLGLFVTVALGIIARYVLANPVPGGGVTIPAPQYNGMHCDPLLSNGNCEKPCTNIFANVGGFIIIIGSEKYEAAPYTTCVAREETDYCTDGLLKVCNGQDYLGANCNPANLVGPITINHDVCRN